LIYTYRQFRVYEEEIASEHEKVNFLNSLFDSFPHPLIFLTNRNEIIELNNAAELFIEKTSKDKLAINDFLEKFSPEFENDIINVIENDSQASSIMVRTLTQDPAKNVLYFDLNVFPVKSDKDRCLGKIILLLDKTSEIITRTRENELKEQLLIMQKHEALSRLAGSIAHDLNNILAIILSNAELIMSLAPEDNIKKHADIIINSAKRGARIIVSLLSYAKGKPAKEELLELGKIIREFTEFLKASVPERIKLNLEVENKEMLIKGSAIQIEQVVLNVISNSIDAIKDGGEIEVIVKEAYVDENKAGKFGYINPGIYACICIKDTGKGMSEEEIDRIFEPYYTTKEKGSGLGLSIVYGIVRKLNGFIEVESEKGKGTEFKIYFPTVRL
jgi:signal transduction histidine kinase